MKNLYTEFDDKLEKNRRLNFSQTIPFIMILGKKFVFLF